MTFMLLIAGFVLLIFGAELLVKGASRLAIAFGISPLIIGLTVVAFGTSSPELAVCVMSSFAGQSDIAVGNVVGSNIFNLLVILGISSLIVPLVVARQLVRLDVPLMIVVSLLMLGLGIDGNISRVDGSILFFGIVAYTIFLIVQGRKENQGTKDEKSQDFHGNESAKNVRWHANIGLIIIGLVLLVLGSRWLVDGAVYIARYFGISELIIGLTIVAAGTSLPEVATSVVASIRGERDIAVGNAVGSSIFNILAVLGLTSILAPDGIVISAAALRFDIPVMIAASIACLPIFFTGNIIARWEGGLFLGYYLAYVLYLFLAANQHAILPIFNSAMIWFVMPMTVLTLIVVTVRTMRVR